MARTMAIITLLLKVTNSINSVREGGLWQFGQQDWRCTNLHLHCQNFHVHFVPLWWPLMVVILFACLSLMKISKPPMIKGNKGRVLQKLNDQHGRSTFTWALLLFCLTFISRCTPICCSNWPLPLTDLRQIGCHAKWTFKWRFDFLDKCLKVGKIFWPWRYCLYIINYLYFCF